MDLTDTDMAISSMVQCVPKTAPSVEVVPVPRLYGTPRILAGEALSGWLWRVSFHHRVNLHSLLRLMKIQWSADRLDFGDRLNQRTALDIASLTLNSPAAIMAAVSPPMHLLANETFRCLTYDLLASTPIYRVCVECLVEDDVPYIRRLWRLAYSLVCDRHPRPLIDCCPRCKNKIDFSRDRFLKRSTAERTMAIRHCLNCGLDLTQTSKSQMGADLWLRLIRFQEALHQIVTLGFFKHPRYGMISASMALENYLTTEVLEVGAGTVTRFAAIDFPRCFGVHASEILKVLSPVKPEARSKATDMRLAGPLASASTAGMGTSPAPKEAH